MTRVNMSTISVTDSLADSHRVTIYADKWLVFVLFSRGPIFIGKLDFLSDLSQ
jgi:hypothetical protein